jgi:hypothetical protein
VVSDWNVDGIEKRKLIGNCGNGKVMLNECGCRQGIV